MKINGMAHCLFEQSGTFKNAFKSFGIHAEDYDIQDNFGETDHVVDIFQGIEDAWDGKPSLFDRVTRDDIVLAFFPCIYFCGISQMNITLASYEYKHGTLDGAGEYILDRIDKRTRFYKLLVKLCTLSIARGFRLVVENPYTSNTYLNGNFIKPPSIVDTDRTVRGDYFVKPTAYWFFGCEPMHSLTRQPTRDEDKKHFLIHSKNRKTHPGGNFAKGSKESGVCSEERSMLSPAYARNFIADFILGEGGQKPCHNNSICSTSMEGKKMSEGHDEPIKGCSLDCALVNGCAMGGMKCEVCGKYFCSLELDSSRVCVECREKLEAEDE